MNNKEKEVSHKVLGLTGTEKEVEVKFNTFCQLCSRRLERGSPALFMVGTNGWEFYIHTDCAITRMTSLHNKTFREDVKSTQAQRSGRVQGSTRTRTHKKREFEGEGNEYCCFCSNLISEGQSYSKVKKKRFHSEGTNSCYNRYQKVMTTARNTLG